MQWRTFQGKVVTLETADQQHLSNVYWFNRIFTKESRLHGGVDITDMQVTEELGRRFNGQILPYRPHVEFLDELRELKKREMLERPDASGTKVRIVMYCNRRAIPIGEIIHPSIEKLLSQL